MPFLGIWDVVQIVPSKSSWNPKCLQPPLLPSQHGRCLTDDLPIAMTDDLIADMTVNLTADLTNDMTDGILASCVVTNFEFQVSTVNITVFFGCEAVVLKDMLFMIPNYVLLNLRIIFRVKQTLDYNKPTSTKYRTIVVINVLFYSIADKNKYIQLRNFQQHSGKELFSNKDSKHKNRMVLNYYISINHSERGELRISWPIEFATPAAVSTGRFGRRDGLSVWRRMQISMAAMDATHETPQYTLRIEMFTSHDLTFSLTLQNRVKDWMRNQFFD